MPVREDRGDEPHTGTAWDPGTWSYAVTCRREEVQGKHRELGSSPLREARLPGSSCGGHQFVSLGRACKPGLRARHVRVLSVARGRAACRRLADLHDLRLDAGIRCIDMATR